MINYNDYYTTELHLEGVSCYDLVQRETIDRPMTLHIRVASLVLAFGLGVACAHEPGVYSNPERQLIYDDAKLSGDCARACCDHVGAEKGLSGQWNSSERTCSWHADAGFQVACVNWCRRETGNER